MRYRCTVYHMKGVTLVPHYHKRGVFVAPGGAEYKREELQVLRAKVSHAHLLPRDWAQKAKIQEVA